MPTPRLHYDDPLLLSGEAVIVAHGRVDGQPTLVLAETYFYPESGGQLGDQGTIGGVRVADVRLDDDGVVHHLVADAGTPLPAVTTTVPFEIDEGRRRQHMAAHTAQHCLSHALLDHHGAITVSSRLGASGCTIDVDRAGLDLSTLEATADLINTLIDEDRPVRQFFPTATELAELSLRKPPPDAERIRVVAVDGFDVTPCGGTHVEHTSQIGVFYLRATERHKGGTRITFDAGPRARQQLLADRGAVIDLARELKCAPAELREAVDRQGTRLAAARTALGAVRGALADQWAARLALEGDAPVVAILEGADPELLDAVAGRLTEGARVVALGARGSDGISVVFARGPESAEHVGELLKRVATAAGGRGGGRPDHARGRLPGEANFEALVAAALAAKP